MDLSTGPGLVSAIADTLNRQDLVAVIPSWIRTAEAQINRALRVREMIKRSTVYSSDAYVNLPTDFLELKSMQLISPTGIQHVLVQASNDLQFDLDIDKARYAAMGFYTNCGTGPRSYSIIGKTIRLAPAPVDPVTVEMVYFASVPPLDVVTPGATNWLLQAAPDVYLYSSLVFSAPYLNEDSRAELYSQYASTAVSQLNEQSNRAQTSGSRLNARPRTF